MAKEIVLRDRHVSIDAHALECPECHGYADETDVTKAEIKSDMNCGRLYACCVAAFICKVCGARIVTRRAAPDME